MQGLKIKKVKRNLITGIFVNFSLVIIKGLAGFFGHSFALMADAIESFADVFSSTLVLFGFNYATRPPDEDHPYGHGKAEALITFIIVLFLTTSAFFIIFKAFNNFYKPHDTPKIWTLFVLAFVIFIKEAYYRYSKQNNTNAKSSLLGAEAEHHHSDAITSLAAFIGISVAVFMGPAYAYADSVAAIIAGIIILFNAYSIFRPALGEVMDEHRYTDFVKDIKKTTLEVDGALATEKCLVRKHGMNFLIDLHLIVDGKISVDQGHQIAHAVKRHLKEKYTAISDVLIHVEPFKEIT